MQVNTGQFYYGWSKVLKWQRFVSVDECWTKYVRDKEIWKRIGTTKKPMLINQKDTVQTHATYDEEGLEKTVLTGYIKGKRSREK